MNEPILKTALPRGRDLISIVSPVYNERDNLGELYRAISEIVKNADFDIEFILVDDGSRSAACSSRSARAGTCVFA
jgi:hypothetical protein